jgi:polyketide cyclase/dehydrase/lipid transport protein
MGALVARVRANRRRSAGAASKGGHTKGTQMGSTPDSVGWPKTGASPDRDYDFEVTTTGWLDAHPEELTAVVLEPEMLHQWCPRVFMSAELIDRGRPDGLGIAMHLHTKGFLPPSFSFVVRVIDVMPDRFMRVAVSGDFEGVGDLFVVPDAGGCRFQVDWRISLMHPLRRLVLLFHWVFAGNHKWAMRRTCRLLEAEVHRRREASGQMTRARARLFPHAPVAFRDPQRRMRRHDG